MDEVSRRSIDAILAGTVVSQPATVGPYRVVRPLGRGGMGTVLLAEDTRLSRLVALKLCSGPEATSAYGRQQVLDEARAAGALNHPNIAAVHDVLEHEGQIAIVFEYVEGDTLATRLDAGPLPLAEALEIGRQLAEALTAAHAHRIVHRDLKPANIIIMPSGLVKVLDFGVARAGAIDESSHAAAQTTRAGFLGTVGYAAPEQYLGQVVDARADVFSLGVVLFEMLTGSRPFPGTSATTVLSGMLQSDPPHVTALVPGIPEPLDRLLRSALSRERDRRPQSAREVRDLLTYLDPRTDLIVPRPSRRRVIPAVAALLAVLATVWLVASLIGNRSAAPPPGAPRPPVVAVMPLVNATGDEGNEYLAVGVAENLTTRLAGLPSITVLSRSTVADARSRKGDLAGLAAELDATYLVHGSVQQAAERLRIHLQLVRPDGSIAWADDVEGRFEDVFGLQTRVASGVAQAIVIQLSAADHATLAHQPTLNAEAQAAYWRGKALFERRDIKGNLEAALALYDEASRLDPRFADAHAARGEALWVRYLDGRAPEDARAAIEAGTTALRLNPESPESRYALAMSLAGTGQLEAAVDELQRSLVLRPNFNEARVQLGSVLARQGRVDEAIAEFRKAIELRPSYSVPHTEMGRALYQAGRYREAAEAFQRVTELQPDNAPAHQQTGVAYHALGETDRALAFYEKTLAIRPLPTAYSNIGAIHHHRGEYLKAVEAYQKAIALRPNARETHRNLGDAYARLDRTPEALEAYRRAIQLAEEDLRVNPHDARILASLAVYLQKTDASTAAEARIDEALRLAPDDFEVLRRAAQVHALAGRTDAALDALEAALTAGFRRETAREEEEFRSLYEVPRFRALVVGESP
jgi:serine/threonine protein kinase/tetratricopeptide (TPR) repeat protein